MDFLSPSQCRAARGLLDWSQPDLAKHCGMHVQTICAFEHETGTPTKRTLEKIMHAFGRHGLKFNKNDGVERIGLITTTYRGYKGFWNFIDLVYETAKNQGGDICVSNVNERIFTQKLGKAVDESYMAKMVKIKNNFSFRIMIEEGDINFTAKDYAEYRWIPKKQFHHVPFYVFGDYLAFLLFGEDTIIHLINNPEIADAQRTQFNMAWDNGIVPHSVS